MKNLSHYALNIFLIFLFICILCLPEAVYQGAQQGINTWVHHLLPALLPFFLIAELLISSGLIRYIGTCLEFIMRPLFRLPGEAALAVVLGFTSGFPMGAVLTASLYEQQLCTKEEAGRLAAFTNNASPLFLLIAVPITMLEQAHLGLLLLLAHYGANFILGLLLSLFSYFRNPYQAYSHQIHHSPKQSSAKLTLAALPELLALAIQKSLKNIFSIGGFVLFFSVLLALLDALLPHLSYIFTPFLEMTLGSNYLAQQPLPLCTKLMLISFVIGWSGLSIQLQVLSILKQFQIPAYFYLICRPLQGILAAFLTWFLFTYAPFLATVTLSFLPTPHFFITAVSFTPIALLSLIFLIPYGFLQQRKK